MWPFKTKKEEATLPSSALFTKADLRIIKVALDYTYHRLTKHDHCGVREIIDGKRLERLRKIL